MVYVGEIDDAYFSPAGWWVTQIARLIGGPLPTGRETGVPIIVTVTEDAASGGQIWPVSARADRFPQVIHSAKRFAGPTGLEADELLRGGQRVIPNKALSSGFVFRHETLRSAFEAIL